MSAFDESISDIGANSSLIKGKKSKKKKKKKKALQDSINENSKDSSRMSGSSR